MGQWHEQMKEKKLAIEHYQRAVYPSTISLGANHPAARLYYRKMLQRVENESRLVEKSEGVP